MSVRNLIAALLAGAALAAAEEPVVATRAKKPRALTLIATAYCPCRRCCGPAAKGRTFTGRRALGRGVAVSRGGRRALPLGSRVRVAGYGTARVDDVGGGIRSNQIDLRFASHQRAREWGKRRVRVILVGKP